MMNGYSERPTNNGNDTSQSTSAILHALELIHSPTSDNDIRREATEFLNQQKDADEAYRPGFHLAADHGRPPIVRHFGLSLIEHTIRLKWHDLTDDQTAQVRGWTMELAHNISEADPPYIRNKVAQLWVELAKKSWAIDWLDMDQVLLALWGENLTSKELVLTILENLSEDTFAREDSAAALRGQELNTALVGIFTPAAQFAGGLVVGKTSIRLRANDEGWLARVVEFIQESVLNASTRQVRVCLTKALATLRSALSWMMLPAIVSTHALPAICTSLSVQDTDVLMVSTWLASETTSFKDVTAHI
jgi:exportin-5